MNKYLIWFPLVVVFNTVYAETETRFLSGESYYDIQSFDTYDVVVESGASVYAAPDSDIMVMHAPIYLHNDGIINGTINTNGENLFLYNTGQITGGITALSDGFVVQRITSESELSFVDVNANDYVVEIYNYQNLNFNDIKDVNANSFVITDSSIIINNYSDWQNWGKNYLFDGNTKIIIQTNPVQNSSDTENTNQNVQSDNDNGNSLNSGDAVVDGNSNTGNLSIEITDIDDLYKVELEYNGSEIVANIVRETDYNKITNNDSSNGNGQDPLEIIRNNNPNDKLVNVIDAATNNDEINRLKNRSYRFNHDILLKPIKVINNFAVNGHTDYKNNKNIGVETYYITSDKIGVFGGRLYFNTNYKNSYFNAGIVLNNFDYSDDLNDFSGVTYGLDLRAKYVLDSVWLNTILGTTLADYHLNGYVINNNEVEYNNPFGKSLYGSFDVGYDIKSFDKTFISPFVGAWYQKYNVIDVSSSYLNLRAGSNIKYNFIVDDIEYEYSISGAIGNNFDLFAKFQFGFNALADMAGASIGLDIFKNEDDVYYKLYANAKVLF